MCRETDTHIKLIIIWSNNEHSSRVIMFQSKFKAFIVNKYS